MIRIKRDKNEPLKLTRARKRQLPRALIASNKYGITSAEFKKTLTGYNHQTIKKRLYYVQHEKCAWCELKPPFSSSPVEHYRPKKGAWRHLRGESNSQIDTAHYWWLTWSWTNLFFSCARCNDRSHKANYFPLVKGTRSIPVPARNALTQATPNIFQTSSERPLLLDPSNDDPLKHIRWIPAGKYLRREQWVWIPEGTTERGKATIQILKLDELSDFVQDHLKTCVLPSIEEIEKHLSASPKRIKDARDRWDKLLANTLAPESELSAATWCALEIWMPKKKRQENGLSEPNRPGS